MAADYTGYSLDNTNAHGYIYGMEPDKNIGKEAEKSTYRLKSDIDTPQEELQDLRKSSKRTNALLIAAALFIIALGALLWWMLAHQASTP